MGWESARARLAVTTRHYGSAAPVTLDARRDLRAARAEDYIKHLVDAAPPLTAEQRDKLAVLLRGSAA